MSDVATLSSARTISKKRSSCTEEFIAPSAPANLKKLAKQCASTLFVPRKLLRSRKSSSGQRSTRKHDLLGYSQNHLAAAGGYAVGCNPNRLRPPPLPRGGSDCIQVYLNCP